jgi:electron transport complex protein RnfE
VLIGGIREILGSGTLFANASLLLGSHFAFLETTIIPDYRGYLLLILPPGGFLVLGFLLAGKRYLSQLSQSIRFNKTATEPQQTSAS